MRMKLYISDELKSNFLKIKHDFPVIYLYIYMCVCVCVCVYGTVFLLSSLTTTLSYFPFSPSSALLNVLSFSIGILVGIIIPSKYFPSFPSFSSYQEFKMFFSSQVAIMYNAIVSNSYIIPIKA